MRNSYTVLGASRCLSPTNAADALVALRKGLKKQVWDRSSQESGWHWYVTEKLPNINYYFSSGENNFITIKPIFPSSYIWPHPSLAELFVRHPEEVGFNYQIGFNVDRRKTKKRQGLYDISLSFGRSIGGDKTHYRVGFFIHHQDTAFSIRLMKEMLRLAGYSDKALTVHLSEDGKHDTFSMSPEIPVGTHPSIDISLDTSVAADYNSPDGFSFSNLSLDTALNWFEHLRVRMSSYRFCATSLEIRVKDLAWDRVRDDLEYIFPGPWALDYFCRAREHHGPETLKEITEVGAFVPLDVMGLKGSGLIYCDALRHEEGWELWFHHDSGGSSAKLAMFRDRIAELSGLPDLFDRPQEFACGGNLDPT